MKKSYLEVCSPVLYPKMVVGGNGVESAGIKHPNLDTYSMVGMMIAIIGVLGLVFFVWM